MTYATGVVPLDTLQHLVLDGVSWDYYEQTPREIGDRALRVTYDDGSMEIISPLRKHEMWGGWINRLIELLCLERSIQVATLGSTTFRNRRKRKGLEPNKCFY